MRIYADTAPEHERLQLCIEEFQDGLYQKSADSLRVLLPRLSSAKDEIEAYKYLGFAYAMLNRIDMAKDVFKTALRKYPSMEIDTLEAPPNITIIFKQVLLEKKLETLDTAFARNLNVLPPRKNVLLPSFLMTAGIAAVGLSANFFYNGYQSHRDYKNLATADQGLLDTYYSLSRNYYIGGIACVGLGAVLVPVSMHLFGRKATATEGVVSLVNGPRLVFLF